jgi:hypothetical protein
MVIITEVTWRACGTHMLMEYNTVMLEVMLVTLTIDLMEDTMSTLTLME